MISYGEVMKALRMFGNSNPAGIIINDGWIALAAAIICEMSVDEALHRVCGIPFGRRNQRYGGCGITEKIIGIYREKPELHNSEIAAVAGCTREMVRIVLKKYGVPKRNKWEGHVSLDPRYYKDE